MLEWFTTIPGILVICGAVLLVIAIILFILGNKKETKNVVADVNSDNTNTVEGMYGIQGSLIKDESQNINESEVNPAVVDFQNTDNHVEVSNEEPVVEITPTVENIPEAVNTVDTPNTIYGGEVPTYNIEIPEEKTVSIYGGNDPMEATQTLPKVEENHEPYSGYPEVKVVEPTPVEEVQPVVDIPMAMPEVAPVEIPAEQPQVVPTSVEEVQPVVDIPVAMPEVAPVEIPTEQPQVIPTPVEDIPVATPDVPTISETSEIEEL